MPDSAFQSPADPAVVNNTFNAIRHNKELRRDVEALVTRIRGLPSSAERTLAMRKLQEAKHWLGEDLHRIGELQKSLGIDPTSPNPYPESKNPDSTVVHPRAD